MRLSKRGEYGIRAMIALAEPVASEHSPELFQNKGIANKERISPKFLEQILLQLKNAGLIHSKSGKGGGYYLAKSASEITLGQIFRVLDGPIAPIPCVSQMAYAECGCPDTEACGLRLVMKDVRKAIVEILDTTTLSDIAERRSHILNRENKWSQEVLS
jgi:Rrf2 family protein